MWPLFDDASTFEQRDAICESDVAGRCEITSVVRPDITVVSAARISCSFVASTAEVASSSTSTAGSARIARAIATRCRCPPESEKPRSPSTVS